MHRLIFSGYFTKFLFRISRGLNFAAAKTPGSDVTINSRSFSASRIMVRFFSLISLTSWSKCHQKQWHVIHKYVKDCMHHKVEWKIVWVQRIKRWKICPFSAWTKPCQRPFFFEVRNLEKVKKSDYFCLYIPWNNYFSVPLYHLQIFDAFASDLGKD